MNFYAIIVSPSGNLYGSERVLLDFLNRSRYRYIIFLPQGSLLQNAVSENFQLKNHRIIPIPKSPLLLVFKILLIAYNRKINSVYFNEGGYIKYLKIISGFAKKITFTNHVRIVEDVPGCSFLRSKNLNLITTSNYMSNLIDSPSYTLYDPFEFSENYVGAHTISSNKINITFIGRVSKNKGFLKFEKLYKTFSQTSIRNQVNFHFYGDIYKNEKETHDLFQKLTSTTKNQNVFFHGYVPDNFKPYKEAHIIVHLNRNESWGRIFLEAINALKPFIGFNHGGIGEIGSFLNITDQLIDPNDPSWPENMCSKIISTIRNYDYAVEQTRKAKIKASKKISSLTYTRSIENFIKGKTSNNSSADF